MVKKGKNEAPGQGLYNIGEVVKACGVTRKTILFYERCGLLEPAWVDPKSGYRYYNVDSVAHTLMQIVQFRDAGLSIAEISDYFSGGQEAAVRIAETLRARLEAMQLSLETVRAFTVPFGDFSVSQTFLPPVRCFVREYACRSVADAQDSYFRAYDSAVREGFCLRKSYDAFAEYEYDFYSEARLNLDEFTMRVCIPVDPDTPHPDCIDFPASEAVCVSFRGDYNGIGQVYDALGEYVRQNGLVPSGRVREYYIDGGRGYAEAAQRYVTRLALPVLASN